MEKCMAIPKLRIVNSRIRPVEDIEDHLLAVILQMYIPYIDTLTTLNPEDISISKMW